MKAWEEENSTKIKSVIKPSVVGYDEVQLNVADKTIANEESQIRKTDEGVRQDARIAAKPTLAEGTKATAVAAVLEGGIAFAVKVLKKESLERKYKILQRKIGQKLVLIL